MNLNNSFRHFQIIAGISAILAIMFTNGGCKETTSSPAVENLSDPSVQPTVIFSVPAPGATGPFSLYDRGDGNQKPHFVLTFNKLMYKLSFTAASFKVHGFDRPVVVIAEGNYYYYIDKLSSTSSIYYDNVIAFFIFDSLTYGRMSYTIGQQYSITLDSSVQDINGNHMPAPVTLTYTPEPHFRVVAMNPKDGSKDVGTSPNAVIQLNSPVDASFIGKIHSTPSLPGAWYLSYDSSAVYFSQYQLLPNNANFSVTIQASATDAAFHPIDREYTSAWSTIAFRPRYIYPVNGASYADLATDVTVEFTGNIDTATIRTGFSLSPAVEGSFSFYPYATYFYFTPSNGLRQNTSYTITINSTLLSALGTPSPVTTSTFRTAYFQINSALPYSGSTNVPRSASLQIATNAHLDTTTIAPAISISPATAGNISLSQGNRNFEYVPSSPLTANTVYTVTISTALATKAGDHLSYSYSYSFTTGY